MTEKQSYTVRRVLSFEKSGETFSIDISMENISPSLGKESVVGFVDQLYASLKKDWLKGQGANSGGEGR